MRNPSSIRNAFLNVRSSRNVAARRTKAAATGFSPTRSFAVRRRGGSGTRRNSGTENASHQIATLANDARTAVSELAKPNHSGFWIQARLAASSSPPPT